MFSAPNTSAIMSSVPASDRGAASGMRSTFQNSGMSLSIGIFFTLLITGLASRLPSALYSGLTAQGVPATAAQHASQLPAVSTVFAAFLGANPLQTILAPTGVLNSLSAHGVAAITGDTFFPNLISGPFHHGLTIVFATAAGMALLAATASLMRGATPKRVAAAPSPTLEEPAANGRELRGAAESRSGGRDVTPSQRLDGSDEGLGQAGRVSVGDAGGKATDKGLKSR